MKTEIFQVYEANPELKAKAIFEDGQLKQVKLMFKSPRGQYYHFLNDAMQTATELYGKEDILQV